MEEQIISFETAKLLKEIGIEEGLKCNYVYCIGYDTVNSEKEPIKCEGTRSSVVGQFHLALAPTQSLVQKYLREKYHLHIHIADLGLYMWSNMIIALSIDGTQGKGGYLGKKNYKTYEESLESGLYEALKLIKS